MSPAAHYIIFAILPAVQDPPDDVGVSIDSEQKTIAITRHEPQGAFWPFAVGRGISARSTLTRIQPQVSLGWLLPGISCAANDTVNGPVLMKCHSYKLSAE